jgi:ADP-ribose pyrophosphatase
MGTETTISTERLYDGRVLNLRLDVVRLEDGKTTRREIIEHRGAVALVAIDDDANVLLVRQFRKAAEKPMLEIPAGTLEVGEEPLACAQRELQEETGFSATIIDRLTSFYPSPGYCTEIIHVFAASGLQPANRGGDEDEDIEVVPVPFSRALEMIENGEICDGKSIIGLLTYARLGTTKGVPGGIPLPGF